MVPIVVLILLAHGIARLVGFIVAWQIRTLPAVRDRTTIFGGSVEVGAVGMRAVGIAWLAMALACGAVAVALLLRLPWWSRAARWTVPAPLVLCLAGGRIPASV